MQDIIRNAQQVLENGAQALLEVSKHLDENFLKAVDLIKNLPKEGRLVIFGVGKAGAVGTKISATFSSIGVPSFFIHPAEAAHGDLGRVTSHDVVLMLSNSGESTELIRVVPYLKRLGCKILTITGSNKSTLAKQSEMVIKYGTVEEAGPLGLAPTTSALVLLALGDALAMSVLSQNPLSREQFGLLHPGGTLGRTLMLVSEVMRQGDEHCVVREDLLTKEVIHRISATKRKPGAAAVVNKEGVLCGVFTDGDLRRYLDKGSEFLNLPIAQVMGKNPKTIEVTVLAEEALKLMNQHQIDQVIVIDKNKCPLGLVDIQDLVQTSQPYKY